jgi:hypothetical protein
MQDASIRVGFAIHANTHSPRRKGLLVMSWELCGVDEHVSLGLRKLAFEQPKSPDLGKAQASQLTSALADDVVFRGH